MISYVRQNEDTSCLKIVHFYDVEKGEGKVPDELEANAKSMVLQLMLLTECRS
jgi:hypothetical protein